MLTLNIENRPQAGQSRLLRIAEAAKYCAMSKQRLRELVRLKRIPVVQEKDGGPWLFDIADLDRHLDVYIARHKTATPLPAGTNGFDQRTEVKHGSKNECNDYANDNELTDVAT